MLPGTEPAGVAGERTDLAWQRTGLGILAVAGLLAHRAVVSDRPAFLVAAGIAALLGLAVLGVLTPLRARHVRRRQAEGASVASPRAVIGVTAAVVVICLAAAGAVIVVPGS